MTATRTLTNCGFRTPRAEVNLSPLAESWAGREWVAIASSHLGTKATLHAEISRYLSRSALECRKRGNVMMVAAGSAIENLARRAAELFDVRLLLVHTDCDENVLPTDTHQCATAMVRSSFNDRQRDSMLIQLADRVDVLSIRPGGRIEAAIRKRLVASPNATTRIAILRSIQSRKQKQLVSELMNCGAVGWYLRSESADQADQPPSIAIPIDNVSTDKVSTDDGWMTTDGEWLVHCTRTPSGPMPGQTLRQHQDAMLLANRDGGFVIPNSPMDALESIVRSRRIVASAIASAHKYPVVCFSEVPLKTLLENRRYRPHLKRWDYEPYGIAIRKEAAIRLGVHPVIYGKAKDRDQVDEADQFRFQAQGRTYDWTAEREWRSSGTLALDKLELSDVRVFLHQFVKFRLSYFRRILELSPWQITVIKGSDRGATRSR